ncbi:trypsin-like peptidase domain-containing protein [Peptoniphilus sp. KCTC 25270]|uniref:S1C family serine protease n=1 Tax=Peptoniphilus sp. KCTC 25270 TaxID=2897414 RepID=UPI001E3066C0|nr:trypsin-like peptidase domain-containing protein [Peptoniphilus sp. KCTC 25270]MCD1147622.1 trypsin-like peptidase domain-containing protein [Peptoniphilus sp. KCTC 25270]
MDDKFVNHNENDDTLKQDGEKINEAIPLGSDEYSLKEEKQEEERRVHEEKDPFEKNKEEMFHPPVSKRKKKRGKSFVLWALIFSLLGGAIGGGVSWMAFSKTMPNEAPQNITIDAKDTVSNVEAVAQKATPSVVGITAKATQMTAFGPMAVEGSGSGFIISEDGYIVSNAHVVGKTGDTVHVLLNNGTEAEGKVVWADSTLDIGLVKIDRTGLPTMEIGSSEDLKIGELAVAIGNPLGLDFQRTVTSGVISGLNRNIGEVEGNYMDGLIQTDASINSGNSGGPLLNKEGKVIGINTVKINTAEGLGFSLPIDSVMPIIEQVMKTGSYEAVSMGISGVSVSAVEKQYRMDLKTNGKGVVVAGVEENSPAANAGLQTNDIIMKLGDRDLTSMGELRRDLYNYKPGDKVKLTISRNGEEKVLELEFSDYKVPKQEQGMNSLVPFQGEDSQREQ